jgi:hypothetical protein
MGIILSIAEEDMGKINCIYGMMKRPEVCDKNWHNLSSCNLISESNRTYE